MCDRYMLSEDQETLAAWFNATLKDLTSLKPNYNIGPGDRMPVVREDESGRRIIARYSWGLLPYWATDEEAGNNTLHARAETLADKSTFRPYFTNRRCLVPAGGVYLWKKEGKKKKPYLIRPAHHPLLAMAGLYGLWEAPTGETVPTYCIITTPSNEKLKILNSRMPAILPKAEWNRWLDPANHDTDTLRELLIPCPVDALDYYKVSEGVNFVHYNYPEMIRPI